MLYKLLKWGISTTFCKILKCMYEQVTSCVKINNKRSEFFVSNIGTRQGCPLSPILFNLFSNDLPFVLDNNSCKPSKLKENKINILMYAND